MSVYLIAIREATKDPVEMETYRTKAVAARGDFERKVLVANGKVKTLEGDAPEAVVVAEFPTFEEAEAWYNSPAYQDALRHRLKGAVYRVMLADGFR